MKLIDDILSNWDTIMQEYNLAYNARRTIPLKDFQEEPQPTPDWRAVTLWWNYKEFPPYQNKMPFTTELVRHGPSHRATGWLILNPHTRTPSHNHHDWGRKIIVHIPTYIPEGDVGFNVEGKIHRWKMGEAFAFDCLQEHWGFNNTNEARSIMVLDFEYDQYYDQLKQYMYLSP
jgi:aspartyl/asparaginyl beta-hydroxylase (cupin superfamily)